MADKDKLVTLEDLKVAYDDTEGKVSDLKSAFVKISDPIEDSSYWEMGAISSSNGSNSPSTTTRIRSNAYRIIDRVSVFAPKSGYKIAVALYTGTTYQTYIGMWNGTTVENTATWFTNVVVIPYAYNGKRYRLVAAKIDNSDISESDGANIAICIKTDTSMEKEGVAADAKAVGDLFTGINSTINGINDDIESIDAEVSIIDKKFSETSDITNRFDLTDGYRINYMSGARSTNSNRSASGFVDIEGFDYIELTRVISSNTGLVNGLAFYSDDDDETFISGDKDPTDASLSELDVGVFKVNIPQNAKYVRVTWFLSSAGETFSCIACRTGELDSRIDYINDELDKLINETSTDLKLPDYYFENDYLDGRISEIVDKIRSSSMKGDSFFWFTDPHYYQNSTRDTNGFNGVGIIKYIQNRINIRKIFCGGDITSSSVTASECTILHQRARNYLSPIWRDLYFIIGNHEFNNASGSAEQEAQELHMNQIYANFIKDKEELFGDVNSTGDYWFDNVAQKIRYFCIGANKGSSLDNTQITWFESELAKTPSGYTVIVMSHIGLASDATITNSFVSICNIMDAANSHTGSFSNTNFVVACAITGHIHRDIDNTTTGGIPIIATTCDRGPKPTSSSDFNAARAYGTINEQAIDVVQIDTEERKIYLTRIGGTFDGTTPLINPDREYSY